MAFFTRIRHLLQFTTVANATATTSTTTIAATTTTAAAISTANSKLQLEYYPDKVRKIYSSVSIDPISSPNALKTTIKRLTNSSRFSDIEYLIESQKSDPKITQEHFLASLIRSYGVAGMFDHALKTFNQMDELGTPRSALSFNALLLACNQSKLFDKVPKLFDEIPRKHVGLLPDVYSYGILVKSYCNMGLPEKAIKILKQLEEKGFEITTITFTTILDALYKKGMSEMGDKIWDQMVTKECLPDHAAYNVRMAYAQDGKDTKTVKALIDEMIKAKLKPDTISYNYLLTCYCKNDMMEEAKKVYEGLAGKGCKPNAVTFRTLVYHMCRNGSFEEGYVMFKESVKADNIPNFGTLRPLVEGLVKNEKSEEAKELIHIVKEKHFPSLMNDWKKVEEELGLVSV